MSETPSPRWARISAAVKRGPIGRSSIYKLAASPKHRGLLKKFGEATIVDMDLLDRILAECPDAEIKEAEEEKTSRV